MFVIKSTYKGRFLMSRTKRIIINLLITAVIGFAVFYITLPAINLQSKEF